MLKSGSSSLVSSYYKTVPLDEAGATDNEATPRGPAAPGIQVQLLEGELELAEAAEPLPLEPGPPNPADDLDEVMRIMDRSCWEAGQAHLGTSWRELRSGRRPSNSPRSPAKSANGLLSGKVSSSLGGRPRPEQLSCDASSEDSDAQAQLCDSFHSAGPLNCSPGSAPLPPLRKRRHQKSGRGSALLKGLAMASPNPTPRPPRTSPCTSRPAS